MDKAKEKEECHTPSERRRRRGSGPTLKKCSIKTSANNWQDFQGTLLWQVCWLQEAIWLLVPATEHSSPTFKPSPSEHREGCPKRNKWIVSVNKKTKRRQVAGQIGLFWITESYLSHKQLVYFWLRNIFCPMKSNYLTWPIQLPC